MNRGRSWPRLVMALVAVMAVVAPVAPAPATASPAQPVFAMYPDPSGNQWGEPSIGADWKQGALMTEVGLVTERVTFNSAGQASWQDVTPLMTALVSADPILFTDHITNRTFVTQLLAACSAGAYSDDGGLSWSQTPALCSPGALFDHETAGGGAYNRAAGTAPLAGLAGYPDSVYYCAQNTQFEACGRSDNGGVAFQPPTPISEGGCGGLTGHVKVAPDGTVYVPDKVCGSQQGVLVSTDNGTTWNESDIPRSTVETHEGNSASDPSIAIGAGGTAYFAFNNANGHPMVSISTNQGQHWSIPTDLSGAFTINNTKHVVAVAGDDDRAAIAFLGTPTGGDDQSSRFTGVWHLYESATYDRGATWTTQDLTPADPVQRGCIWMLGGMGIQCRNLLDFMDATVTRTGRVAIMFPDGCVTSRCRSTGPNDYSAVGTIARQVGGTGLFRAYDASGFTGP
ncbi:MAG: sialidase family protein [Candidatus Dormibacteria bacterium]